MSGLLTSEAAKINTSPVCCRPAAFDANNTQIYFRFVNTIMLVVVFMLLLCQINTEVCK